MGWFPTRSELLAAIMATIGSIASSCYLDYSLPKDQWHCTAYHREGAEHDQHAVCDQYTRKEK